MVATVTKTVRRVEVGAYLEDEIKGGRTKGTWRHVPQSQSVEVVSWNPSQTRIGKNAPGSNVAGRIPAKEVEVSR